MISMRRRLVPAILAALSLGELSSSRPCPADPPVYGTPASYRLFNTSTVGPGSAGCGRYEPLPCCNPGRALDNPRGTGMDDPWRPPHVWPQTRYPVVPAYTRPSYGFYETTWRVLPLCNPGPPSGPIYPAGLQQNQPASPTQSGQPIPSQGQLPRPPVVPPAVGPVPGGPATANPPVPTLPGANGQPVTPNGAAPSGPPKAVPSAPLQPQKDVPQSNELQQQPPKATPPSTTPGLKGASQGAFPLEPTQRSAMLELRSEETPEIRVQPF
jgi:hypothetical protein